MVNQMPTAAIEAETQADADARAKLQVEEQMKLLGIQQDEQQAKDPMVRMKKMYRNVHLQFEEMVENTFDLDIIPFIYQEHNKPENNKLFIYDINMGKINELKIDVNPGTASMNFMYQDSFCLNNFKIVRSSSVKQGKKGD